MNEAAGRLLALLRAALQGRADDPASFAGCDAQTWRRIYRLAAEQGVLALAWDALKLLPETARSPQELCMQWAVNVDRIEKRYRRQTAAIARLASFYRDHDLPVMLLKGHGLSLLYPVPEHRPCGDIDIWLFGRRAEADKLVAREWGIRVDESKEHHTTFHVDGIMVENHYDFVNTKTHASNVRIERLLKRYAGQPGETACIGGVPVSLPPVQFNALFLLRHAAMHFAAVDIGLRHVADWAVFVAHSRGRIDWPALYAAARDTGMTDFLNSLNAICIDSLGLDAGLFPLFVHDAALEGRVLNEILSPEFSEEPPSGLLRTVGFKTRRWWANRWKHRIVYRERLALAFVRSSWAHLRRPHSIAGK